MAESMSSLHRRGMISSKVMSRMGKPAILRQTRAQPSKMARMDDKSKTDDYLPARGTGVATGKTIDKAQGAGTPAKAGGLPSKGARVNKTAQAGIGTINQDQTPKFPAGGNVKKNSKPVGRQGLGGTAPGLRSSGPQYGGPSSRKFG